MKLKPNSSAFIIASLVLISALSVACQPESKPTQSSGGNDTALDTPEVEPATIPPETIATEVQFFPPMTQAVPPEAIATEVQFFAPLTPTAVTTCSNSMPSRLSIDQRARVAFTDGSDMRIRVRPGFDQDILELVPEGTEFIIVTGPQCADDILWWQIRTENGLEGWMAEYQGNVYLLEAMP